MKYFGQNPIRLFVNANTISWETTIHLTTLSRLYAGPVLDYNIYRVMNVNNTDNSLDIHTFSPIDFLQRRNDYTCYYKYLKYNDVDTRCKWMYATLRNTYLPQHGKQFIVYVPRIIEKDDRLVIQNINYNNPQIALA